MKKEQILNESISSILRPGTHVECALRTGDEGRGIDVRDAVIYDTNDDGLVLSQTNPELSPEAIGKRIAVTSIRHKDNVRLGAFGKIHKIVNDFLITEKNVVSAVYINEFTQLKQFNLRWAYRVRPFKGQDINLFTTKKDKLEIIDFSSLGIKFSHEHVQPFTPDQEIRLLLQIPDKMFSLSGRIVRKEHGQGLIVKNAEFVAVKFQDLDKTVEDELARAVREIERHNRFRKLYV